MVEYGNDAKGTNMPLIDRLRAFARNNLDSIRGQPNTQPHVRRSNYFGGNALTSGGLVNAGTGMGGAMDHTQGNLFTPTRIWARTPLEILGVESWVARNMLDIPIHDMFIRWRHWVDDDEGIVEAMEEAEMDVDVKTNLREAMIAGDQYGTGIVVMMTKEAPMEEPLIPERVREGDLSALHYFDRYDISVDTREPDIYSKNFNQPVWYSLHPSYGGVPMRVHHSRVIRFDGIRPPTRSGFQVYDQDFGVSIIVPILTSILQDQTLATGISHMSQEASLAVLHITGLRDAIAGTGDEDEQSPDQIGQQINRFKSIYRLMLLDEPGREEFNRIAIQFGGLADLMDKFAARVAAARKIPITRFLGSPPIGMDATGDSDMRNYIMMMEAAREAKFHSHIDRRLDIVLARHAGLKEAPEYEWHSLLELSEQEIAEAAKMKAEALTLAVAGYWIDEEEARDAINGDPIYGELSGDGPEAPDPLEMELAKIDAQTEGKIKTEQAKPKPPGTNGNKPKARWWA